MLFGKRRRLERERQEAQAQSEREAREAAFRAELLDEVRAMISLSRIDGDGVLNCRELNAAIRNIPAAQLNIKFFGYALAQSLAAELPVRRGTVARQIGLSSKASTQADMESDWVAHWCGALGIPVIFHRKIWEYAYLLQALHEHGQLRPEARGLGFGCGQEPIPSFLAAQGISVTVTDLAHEEAAAAGWARTHQHAASTDHAFDPKLVDRATFDRLVQLRIVDMNAIPDDLTDYDFCWSICALEHLGSIERGLRFIERSLATLKPGGVAVHTTEFNIDPGGPTIDHWPTVLFQRGHLVELAQRLEQAGHEVAPLDFDLGDKPLDRFIDLPPWAGDLPPELGRLHAGGGHLKLAVDGFVSTCFGIVIKKAG